jgi:hypothetical protein
MPLWKQLLSGIQVSLKLMHVRSTENRTLLALFIFSIKMSKMCALILGHPVLPNL